MAAFALVDLLEEDAPLSWLDAALEDAAYAALVQLVVDDGEGLGAALDLPGQDLVRW